MTEKIRYSFSGHESFYCKSLWLKKGYDFIDANNDFNTSDAVIKLGVGRNMVSSIRFWMRAFGLHNEDGLTPISQYLFDNQNGRDVYVEDLGTLWLLHYFLVKSEIASIYKLFFVDFHRERNYEFTKEQLLHYLKRRNAETLYAHLFNENTVKRDIGVLFQNYVTPQQNKSNEDFAALLINLNLIKQIEDKSYYFNIKGKNDLPLEILLYAIIDDKKNEDIVPFEKLMDIALIFCLTKTELIDAILLLTNKHPDTLRFTDDGGIKQLFFLKEMDKTQVLDTYYLKR